MGYTIMAFKEAFLSGDASEDATHYT